MLIQRLKDFLEFKGLTFASLERELSVANGTFGRALKSSGSFASSTLEKILMKYPDLSAEWLLRGEGDMQRALEKLKPAVRQAAREVQNSDDFKMVIAYQRDLIDKLVATLQRQADAISRVIDEKQPKP